MEGSQGEHAIVKVLHPLDGDRDLFPRGPERAPELNEARCTAIDPLGVHEATRGLELKLGREVVEYPFEVTSTEGVETPPHDLYVLPRHRPRSISREGALRERG
jgi:hypothetical protein